MIGFKYSFYVTIKSQVCLLGSEKIVRILFVALLFRFLLPTFSTHSVFTAVKPVYPVLVPIQPRNHAFTYCYIEPNFFGPGDIDCYNNFRDFDSPLYLIFLNNNFLNTQ